MEFRKNELIFFYKTCMHFFLFEYLIFDWRWLKFTHQFVSIDKKRDGFEWHLFFVKLYEQFNGQFVHWNQIVIKFFIGIFLNI